MVKKTGLGKGLDALFSMPVAQEDEIEETKEEREGLRNLKIIDIEPNREQPRKFFDEESISELSESIKMYGVIQPIVVSKKEGYYAIIAGERRWRAAKQAGLKEIPAIIRDDDDRKNKEISLIENMQREDLNAYEKAAGIKALMEEYNMTQEEIAKVLGKGRSSIANSVRVLNLSPEVLELAKQGKLTEGHCKALLAITDPKKQLEMATRMIERGDSVRQAEKKIHHQKNHKAVAEKYAVVYKDIEDRFQGFFGTKVKIDAGKRSGKIIINYTNNDELERILGLIK
jgi:ParB family chromosome partitioning protein